VKAKPSIPIKNLIAEIQSRHDYSLTQASLEGKTKGINNANRRMRGII